MIKSTIPLGPNEGETEFSGFSCSNYRVPFEVMADRFRVTSDSFSGVRPSPAASLYRRARRYIPPRPYIGARDFTRSSGYAGLTGVLERAPINKPFRVSSYFFKEKT
jgi:hypothetical protein